MLCFARGIPTGRVLKVELKEPEHKASFTRSNNKYSHLCTSTLRATFRLKAVKNLHDCKHCPSNRCCVSTGGAVCMIILFSVSNNRPAKTCPNLFKYPSSLLCFLTSSKHKKYTHRRKTKILMTPEDTLSVHQCFNSIFLTEKRVWTPQTWLPPSNKMIWKSRLIFGDCLVDITWTTDDQSLLFWTWPCWMCDLMIAIDAYVFVAFQCSLSVSCFIWPFSHAPSAFIFEVVAYENV